MKLFNKLANILFDEEVEEEIPVITKEKEIKEEIKKEEPKVEEEIIINKVEVKKEEHRVEPKKEEIPKEIEEESVHTKKFTFPFIDDDEDIEEMPKRSDNRTIEDFSYAATSKVEEPKKRSFLSVSDKKTQKSDTYTANRNNINDPTRDSKTPFTLSPIISPVYGILNENYTKDDIVEKNTDYKRGERIDFDSVRRKAYGTLEDEIEESLTKQEEKEEIEPKEEMSIDNLKDDGISINDLLVNEEEPKEELFRVEELEDEELEDETIEIEDEETEEEEKTEPVEEEKEVKREKKYEERKEEEDDLFDLIDSIYAGKDEK